MSYKSIIYMTECSICYEPFIIPGNIEERLMIYKRDIVETANKTEAFINSNRIFEKIDRRVIINQCLRNYYEKLWEPNYKQYKCSTQNCDTVICGTCKTNIENKSDSILFRCTHCRLPDWKDYMTKQVFPELIMVYLSTKCENRLFSLKDFAHVGYLL